MKLCKTTIRLFIMTTICILCDGYASLPRNMVAAPHPSHSATTETIIFSEDFEDGLVSWTYNDNVTTTDGRNDQGIQITNRGNASENMFQTLTMTFQAGKTYLASVWCRADVGSRCNMAFGDHFSGYDNVSSILLPTTGQWQQLSVGIKMTQDESMTVALYSLDTDITVVYDDLVIREVTSICADVTEVSIAECEALVAIYNGTGGSNWTVKENWLQNNMPCGWAKVTCQDDAVTGLRLSGESELNFGLVGNLPADIGNLTNLTTLSLGYNQLGTLPPELWNLASLTHLYLSSIQLKTIPTEISNLKNLTKLSLMENDISTLPDELWNLTALTNLYLSSNQLTIIPVDIGNLNNLNYLSLKENAIANLPDELWNLTSLIHLYLSSNQLNTIPTDVGNLTNLTILSLGNNQLTSIPSEIGNLASLESLLLSNNDLASVPNELWDLRTLTTLNLSDNQLNSISSQVGNLTNLTRFELNGNQLTTLPPEIGNLSNLTTFDLSENQLTDLPNTFLQLNTLSELDVTNNHLINVSLEMKAFLDEKDPDWANTQTALSTSFTPTPTLTFTHTPNATSTPALPTPTSTPIATPTPVPTLPPTDGPIDAYESDDNCALARSIGTDGIPQHHTFHTVGDTDWATFTAPTAGIYRIEVTIPETSNADVDLYYYTDCDSLHKDLFTAVYAPGIRLDVEAHEAGQQFYLQLKNFDDLQAGAHVSYHLSVRQMPRDVDDDGNKIIPGPAIVVAGRYRGGDSVQSHINQIAIDAYKLFESKGRNDSEIYFLATDSSLPGYDGPATERTLELAITEWAKTHLSQEEASKVITLYLVDHGDRDKLYLDKVTEEILVPEDLDQWLTQLEDEFPGLLVNVIIEACHAGSFITHNGGTISKPGRVVITSSDEDYDAYVSRHGAVFSDDFITFLHQEHNLGYSFQQSAKRVQDFHRSQQPWIDANGNSTPNEADDIAQASLRSFAEAGTLGDDWPPYIASATYMDSPTDTDIHFRADVRHKGGNTDLDDVWGVVYPPDYFAPTETASESDGELNQSSLNVIEFVPEDGTMGAAYVEAMSYPGFTQTGIYTVVIHARDVKGLSARPVAVTVKVVPTPTSTPTNTLTPTSMPTSTSTPTPTNTNTSTSTSTSMPTATPTTTPTLTATPTPVPPVLAVPLPVENHRVFLPSVQR
ncbi:MAG: leucine-rich repeat domain-containing protein [Chloroflexota bacterium]